MLVKAYLAGHLDLSHVQPPPADTNEGSFQLAAEGRTWIASDIGFHQLQTISEQCPKRDPSRQAINSAEMNSTLFFFIMFVTFSFS